MSNIKENTKEFFCECCSYTTDRKDNFTRHMVSKKHQKKMNGEDTSSVDEPKPKTRKPRTPKEKKNNIEMIIQSDSDEELDLSDYTVECEPERVEMTTQTDDIIENEIVESNIEEMYKNQIRELKEMYEKQINELKEENELLKDNIELLQTEKEELQQQIEIVEEEILKNDDKLESLINDNETLKYQKKNLEEKIIYDLNCQIQDMMELIEDKKMLEEFEIHVKFEYIKEQSNDDIIMNLRHKVEKIQEFIDDVVKNIAEQPKQTIEPIVEPTVEPIVEPIIQEKPKKKIILSKVEIEEPKVIISEPVPQSKLELEILRKLEILENQIPKISQIQLPKKSKKSPKNYGDETQSTRADRDINNYRDTKHLMFQNKFKKLCRNSKYNKFIKYYNYTDSNGINCNVMLPANLSMLELETTFIDNYTRGNQNIIYEDAFKHLLSNVNYRHIPFICTNQRNYTFKVLDFDNDGEWVNVNQTELIEYLKPYINILWETFYESINNLVQNDDINDEVMKQLYDIPNKKCFLHDTSRYQYVLANTINPLSDTKAYGNKQTDAELFQACLINYVRTTFTMSIENFTPPEEYDDSIDREVDYSQNFNNVYYEPYHNKPIMRYVRTSNVWNDED